MAMTLNQVQLIGHLGADPETRTFQDNNMIATLSIATTESWKDRRTGDRVERTEWHRVVIKSDALARMAADYLRKGALVFIQGKLQTRKWQGQDGKDNYILEIVVVGYDASVKILDSRNKRDGGGGSRSSSGGGSSSGGRGSSGGGGYDQSPSQPDFDDEIPF